MFEKETADRLFNAMQSATKEWAEMSEKCITGISKEDFDRIPQINERFTTTSKAYHDYIRDNPPLTFIS